MNEKEVAEIRRRFKQEKSGITHIRGCFVNENREIVSEFDQSLLSMSQDEAEMFLGILKKTLSGTLNKNLLDISFETSQVVNGGEHKLLMDLKNSSLKDETAVRGFFGRVKDALVIEGGYLILLAHDTYDVPYRSRDGGRLDDASDEVFSYFVCAVCPIKTTKPALSYYITENEFHNRKTDWIVSPPELGFMFPSFDDRTANIYDTLYYTRDTKQNHEEFIDAVFKTEIPMPAAQQKETFDTVLGRSIAGSCDYEVVQSVHEQLCGIIEDHKQNKDDEPLMISKKTVERVLKSCGVNDDKVESFGRNYDSEFGEGTEISPRNIVDTNKFEVRTPQVTINVKPEDSGLIETQVINGAKYILIRADAGVEVNGISIDVN